MLTYLFIVFVIVLALAPLTQVLPSKRQRKIARLREYAAVHGLFVEFRSVPGAARRPRPEGDVIYYGKRLPSSCEEPVASVVWERTEAGWQGVSTRASVPAILAELPAQVLAASTDPTSCGIYWTEAGEEETVEQIRQALERWSAQLAC